MDDYISREMAISEIKEDAGCDFCNLKMAACCLSCSAGKKIIRIRQMAAADVRPVVRAFWVGKMEGVGICSNCKRLDHIDPLATHCRYCGADMREPQMLKNASQNADADVMMPAT